MNLRTRAGKQKAALSVFALAIVIFTFAVVLPKIADYGSVWEVVKGLDATWIAVLLLVTAFNIVTYAPPWMVALPGLRFRQALPFTQASTAFTYVAPGGGLVGMAGSFGLLRTWGFPNDSVARAVTITGIWNQLANLLLPVAAVFMLTAEEETDTALTTVAFVGAAIFGVAVAVLTLILWSAAVAREVGDLVARGVDHALGWVRRGPVGWGGESLARFRDQTVDLIRRRWWLLTIAAIVGNLAVFLVLLVSIRAVGISSSELTWIEVFAGWSVARVLQLIPLTPGGLGPVEVGLTSVLVAFGGENAEVVAATLVYRFLTIVPTLLLGLATILAWRRLAPDTTGGRSRRASGESSDRMNEQSHKDEMAAALRGDFARLRARGVEPILTPASTDGTTGLDTPSELAAPHRAEGVARSHEDPAGRDRPSWLDRLRGRS